MPLHSLRRLFFPLLLLSTAFALRETVPLLDPAYQVLLGRFPYVTLGIVLAFCAYFNRSCLFTATLMFLIIYYLIHVKLQVSLSESETLLIYTIASLILPLTLCSLFLVPERGLRNRYGILVVSIVPIQLLIAAWLFHYVSMEALLSVVENYFPPRPFGSYVLSINATLGYAVVAFLGGWRLCKEDNEYVAALLTILIFGYCTFAFFYLRDISVVMFSAAGVSLIISLMRSSYDMVYRDELTGLLGRRALNERLKGLGGNYVIAMLDVDHFKKFNDTYGHNIGDEVLKMVAKQIAAVKGGGIPYRYGGEEFCVVFPSKKVAECRPFLEAVRLKVEGYRMVLRNPKSREVPVEIAKERRGRRAKIRNGKTVSVTISIGVADTSNRLREADDVLKAADAALYKAKKAGRNRLAASPR